MCTILFLLLFLFAQTAEENTHFIMGIDRAGGFLKSHGSDFEKHSFLQKYVCLQKMCIWKTITKLTVRISKNTPTYKCVTFPYMYTASMPSFTTKELFCFK